MNILSKEHVLWFNELCTLYMQEKYVQKGELAQFRFCQMEIKSNFMRHYILFVTFTIRETEAK